ncbi:glutamate synthase (NADPH/NADH) small chain [Puccinia sorghi]|uniref:Glutamate synthase (NADPH/NADH) small chain n=1 Tax=Puccinia sorghi TaxID=27349 RepID=A0A0L6V2S8_9BASI|nr:glutamate synthase (NADPH/NADH) small chain [Puccinia sorghi]
MLCGHGQLQVPTSSSLLMFLNSKSVGSPLDKLLYQSPVNTTGVISGMPTSTIWCQLSIYKTPCGQRINWHTILTQNAQKQVFKPWHELVKPFCTGAMSYGSILQEAHSAIAISMDRLSDKLNTGEAGEDASCSHVMPNGDSMRSAIKQVASGWFGVNSTYLANSDKLPAEETQVNGGRDDMLGRPGGPAGDNQQIDGASQGTIIV